MRNAECGFGPSSLREFLGSQFSVRHSAFSIPKLPMFPINLSITRVNKHTQTVWSFFMVPQSGPRPEFKSGQVAILKLKDYDDHDLVFVAMGTGLAPLRSTLRHLFRSRKNYGRLVVLYGARTTDDFCFEREMATEWREQEVELRQVISQPNGDWSGPTGYVQSLLDNIVPELRNPVALVCGSKEMIEQTRLQLLNLGFAPGKILTNY